MSIYLLTTYEKDSIKVQHAYTIASIKHLIRFWSEKYEGLPYQIKFSGAWDIEYIVRTDIDPNPAELSLNAILEDCREFLLKDYGIEVYYYENIEKLKDDLDDPLGWLNQSRNIKERAALEKLYNDNKQGVTK